MSIFFILPLPETLLSPQGTSPTRITDRHGTELYAIRHPDYGTQKNLTYNEIPPRIIRTLIATEDRSFFWHLGISLRGIVRAFVYNLRAGHVVAGGSTLTQQLVRIRLQTPRQTLRTKIMEIFYAIRLDATLSKEEILKSYLNTAYFGHQAYGIAAAADTYFDQSVQDLSIAQTALLIGLLSSPSRYDPFMDFPAAVQRSQSVLTAMLKRKVITPRQYENARTEKLRLAHDSVSIQAPHFVMWLLSNDMIKTVVSSRRALPKPEAQEGACRGAQHDTSQYCSKNDHEVRTTLDLNLQQEIERSIDHQLSFFRDRNVTSAAVIVLDARTGELLSMVGSSDYFDTEHDGAVNVATAPRQPGSAMKPFTYALALQKGDTAATTVHDIAAQYFTQKGNPYTPRNYDYRYHGLVRYREALANSYNIAAVKVAEKVGVDAILNLVRSAGITTLTQDADHYGVALTLGDGEVTLLELSQAYGIFARGGSTLPLKIFPDESDKEGKQILNEDIAWLITDILSDNEARVPQFGPESPMAFPYPVAAKTGTTRNARDNWMVGFTPERIVGVWVGNADNSPMRNTSGISGAGPIFHDVMNLATADTSRSSFSPPATITQRTICIPSGKLPTEDCPHTIEEKFIRGTEPTENDDIYQSLTIDTRNNLLASESCPDQFTSEETFMVFPDELTAWAREEGHKEPPRTFSPLCKGNDDLPSNDVTIQITNPQPFDSFLLDPLIPDADEVITLKAIAPAANTIDWYVDDVSIGTASAPDFRLEWRPQLGWHTIKAQYEDNSEEIRIEVVK